LQKSCGVFKRFWETTANRAQQESGAALLAVGPTPIPQVIGASANFSGKPLRHD
jgi:hypothetical protein